MQANDFKELIASLEDGILTITLNRPEQLNTLSYTLKNELLDCLGNAATDVNCKVIVLTGAGRTFCAGGDLKGFGGMDVLKAREHMSQIGTIVTTIKNLEKPVIAWANGYATGAGCNLAIACDIVFASKSAKFCQSFIKVGLVPDGGGTYYLPRLIGLSKAKDLVFTGRMLTAEEAYQLGLVTFVEEDEAAASAVHDYALALAAGATSAIGIAKMLLNRSANHSLDEMLELERFSQAVCMQTGDHKEGLLAFQEKRKPSFGIHAGS
jgi:2-(1,2-epoxy-1,2-dihydrophenyl)acetyl-CoA isomerase